MKYILQLLPYKKNSLEPYISERTIDFHYEKHYRSYVDNFNNLVENIDMPSSSIEELISNFDIRNNYKNGEAIFNNASQAWNHDFFWKSIKPYEKNNDNLIDKELENRLNKSFKDINSFKSQFENVAISQFGSGWIWLVLDKHMDLKIIKTNNGDNPMLYNFYPLFTCDVWEHSYYLDYQNRRKDYVSNLINHLINWDFISSNVNLYLK